MQDDSDSTRATANSEERPVAPPRKLSPAAERALEEAAARRAEIDARAQDREPERGGRGGLEPGRYGDWEIKGLTSDF
ncbi:hypothetical protein GCM10007989_19810 [Devosia pacifica]|uniref:DUF1674 domain-containing protein n=1 Tax=Devosia pacifica TaxID=1335967 RepID=A0A918S5H9_9HYPH|nr:DUF1674 domain-containing protein [Devosia pacifica]GHA24190.1 hypothetical protein GCM10007989_19810 [Devosia pacifica]